MFLSMSRNAAFAGLMYSAIQRTGKPISTFFERVAGDFISEFALIV
jgi:hypothetical protein